MAPTSKGPQPLLGSAPVACLSCRRLKMRCIGADNPPCVRCFKAGHNCIVNASRRGLRRRSSGVSSKGASPAPRTTTTVTTTTRATRTTTAAAAAAAAAATVVSGTTTTPVQSVVEIQPHQPGSPAISVARTPASSISHSSRGGGSSGRPHHATTPRLPSVYSSSPVHILESIASQASPGPAPARIQAQSRASSVLSIGGETSHAAAAAAAAAARQRHPPRKGDIPDHVLVEFIDFFREKIQYCVPVIDQADLQDSLDVIRHRRPLAYCASFVASQFIPGGTKVRDQLLGHVAEFLDTTSGPLATDESILWMQLQAFAILYAYCPSSDIFHVPHAPRSPKFLNHWSLKYSIEAFSLRVGLHRALDNLRDALWENPSHVSESPEFERYVYWLWLFTMSHHFSLMTRTPPTIREDSTITAAVDILKDIPKPSRVTRILAEVDLYMLWHQASRWAPGLGEWWCSPPDVPDLEEVLGVLEDASSALEVWGQRWGLRGELNTTMPDLDVSKNGAVDFHFRSTRFCISTFGTRYIFQQAMSLVNTNPGGHHQPDLARLTRESVVKSVEAAHTCARYLLDLPPLRRENVRYMADFGFAVIAFCCLYILQAYELFGKTLPELQNYISSVREVGTFMLEMAVANNVAPRLFGLSVLQQFRKATSDLEDLSDEGVQNHHPPSFSGQVLSNDSPFFQNNNQEEDGEHLEGDAQHFDELLPTGVSGEGPWQPGSQPSTTEPLFSFFDRSWNSLLG